MFDFQKYTAAYLAQPGQNDATRYGAYILSAPHAPAWRCIGIHHLTPDENAGKHNVFIDVLDAAGTRLHAPTAPLVGWTWEGRRENENAPPITLDKPDAEPGCNVAIDYNQTIAVWVEPPHQSDVVNGMHTRHPDESTGNTLGHHSFYVVFQYMDTDPGPAEPPPAEPPETDPPVVPGPIPTPTATTIRQVKYALRSARNTVTRLEAMLPKP